MGKQKNNRQKPPSKVMVGTHIGLSIVMIIVGGIGIIISLILLYFLIKFLFMII